MVTREIIEIDESLCTGCSLCIPNCHEGALQIIGGKARLISDLFCDSLGACVGHCPEGAMTIVKKEAESYDERKTMEKKIIPKGENTILAHMKHLKEHGATKYLDQAFEVLDEHGIKVDLEEKKEELDNSCGCDHGSKFFEEKPLSHNHGHAMGGFPGSRTMSFDNGDFSEVNGFQPSALQQWPVQLHLVSPFAPYFDGADVLLAADCTAFAVGDFYSNYLKGKALTIACPKLDTGMDVYLEKIKSLIDDAKINTLTVMIMQVPCCMGLAGLAQEAVSQASRKIPVKQIVVGVQGDIISEDWL